jgi:hypothetical protein
MALSVSGTLSWRRWGTFFVMALTAACAMILALMLRLDVRYVFASATPSVLGNVLQVDPANLESNRYVRLEGAPMVSNAVYYEHALGGSEFVAFALAGQRDVWVQVPIEPTESGSTREAASGAFARREFEGRLVRVGDLGSRFDSVRGYVAGSLHQPMDGESWVLLADEEPADYGWAIAIVLLVIGFVFVDAWLLLRWFKPLPVAPVA